MAEKRRAKKRPADHTDRITVQSNRNDDLYWQSGKSASESFIHLYENKIWTDVRIRCKDHVIEDPDDRLFAHKLILAARSPVFSAKFYGQTAWNSDELDMSTYTKTSVDAFLRCIYTDDELSITVAVAHEVIMIAHLYQVKPKDWLEETIRKGIVINEQNACQMLNFSVIYELTSLRDSILEFIDDNAVAVLNSKGFLNISRDTLEYLLRGDTLLADERNIVYATIKWAIEKLKASNKNVDGSSIREVLGRAFCFLRMGTIEGSEFAEIEETYCFHNRKECLEIFSQILGRRGKSPRCILQSDKRVSRTTTTVFSEKRTGSPYSVSGKVEIQIEISTKKDISVTQFIVELSARKAKHSFQSPDSIHVTLSCNENGFHNRFNINKSKTTGASRQTLTLKPPLKLPTKTTPYMLNVKLESPDAPNAKYYLAALSTNAAGACNNPSVNIKKNGLVAAITFEHPSCREENGKIGNVDHVQNAGSSNKKLKITTSDQG